MICDVSVSRLLGFVKLRIDVWMNDRFLELFTRMLTSKRINIKPKKRRSMDGFRKDHSVSHTVTEADQGSS